MDNHIDALVTMTIRTIDETAADSLRWLADTQAHNDACRKRNATASRTILDNFKLAK